MTPVSSTVSRICHTINRQSYLPYNQLMVVMHNMNAKSLERSNLLTHFLFVRISTLVPNLFVFVAGQNFLFVGSFTQ